MGKKIIIDSNLYQMRVALVDDRELLELFIEDKTNETIIGNIYKGSIKNVLPGMQAVFIDIGEPKNGFLSLENKTNNQKIYPGMDITVQVKKEATGSKGVRLDTDITLTGRLAVILTNQDYVGISQKIIDKEERKRLKQIAYSSKPQNYGIIIRTNAEFKAEADIKSEIEKLYNKCENILSTGEFIKSPALLYKDSSILDRTIRDLVSDEIEAIIINDENDYNNIIEISKEIELNLKSKIQLYTNDISLFNYYSIESQIEKALQKHVWLKSGGFLIIEQTEACVVIDVNTGKFTGKRNLEETIFKTNKEAAVEIAKQLKLRNLSGIIIVDFIDMESTQNQNKILEILEAETKKDRVKTSVVGITELGLIQLTRKKIREPLQNIILDQCPYCKGTDKIYSTSFCLQKLYHEIDNIFKQTIYNELKIIGSKDLIKAFEGENKEYINKLQQIYNKKISTEIKEGITKNNYMIQKQKIDIEK